MLFMIVWFLFNTTDLTRRRRRPWVPEVSRSRRLGPKSRAAGVGDFGPSSPRATSGTRYRLRALKRVNFTPRQKKPCNTVTCWMSEILFTPLANTGPIIPMIVGRRSQQVLWNFFWGIPSFRESKMVNSSLVRFVCLIRFIIPWIGSFHFPRISHRLFSPGRVLIIFLGGVVPPGPENP